MHINKVEYLVPTRGIIGYRSEFTNTTRGKDKSGHLKKVPAHLLWNKATKIRGDCYFI
jgi:predicted membrane GTPase involved in stress response